MIYKVVFLSIFLALFLYAFIRPFSNIFARLFLLFGSFLGFISIVGSKYANKIALFLGVENGSYLYLYTGLLTIFLFIFFTLNKFSDLRIMISKLTRQIALLEEKIESQKKNNLIFSIILDKTLLIQLCQLEVLQKLNLPKCLK